MRNLAWSLVASSLSDFDDQPSIWGHGYCTIHRIWITSCLGFHVSILMLETLPKVRALTACSNHSEPTDVIPARFGACEPPPPHFNGKKMRNGTVILRMGMTNSPMRGDHSTFPSAFFSDFSSVLTKVEFKPRFIF